MRWRLIEGLSVYRPQHDAVFAFPIVILESLLLAAGKVMMDRTLAVGSTVLVMDLTYL